jgi:hypothetical protein
MTCTKQPCKQCGKCGYVCRYCGVDLSKSVELLGKDAWGLHLNMHLNEAANKALEEAATELEFGANAVAHMLRDAQAKRLQRWSELAKKCRDVANGKIIFEKKHNLCGYDVTEEDCANCNHQGCSGRIS